LAYEPAKNKVAILFFVGELDIPLNNSQIAHFFVENNLINYFDLQQLINELVSAGHLNCSILGGSNFYTITPKGIETIHLFIKQVPGHLKDKIKNYSYENRTQMKKESQLTAEYKKIADKEYEVTCKALENQMVLVELKINVATAKQAGIICTNWKNNALEVCKAIMERLI
jgi:predicted transcriptional regulator